MMTGAVWAVGVVIISDDGILRHVSINPVLYVCGVWCAAKVLREPGPRLVHGLLPLSSFHVFFLLSLLFEVS